MNERQYIYRTLLPLAGVATALLVLWVVMLNGVGTTVEWRSHVRVPAKIPPMADQPEATTYRSQPTLQEYLQVWSAPLFNFERQPDATNAAQLIEAPAPALDNVMLTGVVIAQELKVALLRVNNAALAMREGQPLPNGWLVERISERQIELVHGQTRQRLEIESPRLPMTLP